MDPSREIKEMLGDMAFQITLLQHQLSIKTSQIASLEKACEVELEERERMLTADTRIIFDNNMLANDASESSSTRLPTIASASSITLGPNDIYKISGGTTISSMSGGWIGRTVQLITTSSLTFSGVGFNNSKTTAAGELVTAVFDGSKWSL